MSAISKAVEIVGSQKRLAEKIGARQNAVCKWVNYEHKAPVKFIRKISLATNNTVTVEQLLTDHEAQP